MSSECAGKDAWPELVGTEEDYATGVIERENIEVNVIVISVGTQVTGDFRCDRVRVWINEERIVVETPMIG